MDDRKNKYYQPEGQKDILIGGPCCRCVRLVRGKIRRRAGVREDVGLIMLRHINKELGLPLDWLT